MSIHTETLMFTNVLEIFYLWHKNGQHTFSAFCYHADIVKICILVHYPEFPYEISRAMPYHISMAGFGATPSRTVQTPLNVYGSPFS